MQRHSLKSGIVLVLIFALGCAAGYYAGSNTAVYNTPTDDQTTESAAGEQTTTDTSSNTNNTSGTADSAGTGFKVDPGTLSEGQKTFLQTAGVDPNNLVITPEMITCAEAKIGAERMTAIKNGDSPSITEGIALAACYKSH